MGTGHVSGDRQLLQEVCVESTVMVTVNMIYFCLYAGGNDVKVAYGIGSAFIIRICIVVEILCEILLCVRR